MKHTLADQVPVAITFDDGTTAVLSFLLRGSSPTLPVGASWSQPGIWERPATDSAIFAELSKAFPPVNRFGEPKPQPVSYTVVTWDAVPHDRSYRDAWLHDKTNGFSHDMVKARQIHLNKIRRMRAPVLAALDLDWMRATGQNKKQEADTIEAQRQTLRDLPQTVPVAQAQTIEELKALWPTELPQPPSAPRPRVNT